MISQRCPKCHSNRIRRGYRPTPFWSKILFRYYLLCNECNWSFTGFAVPGTVGKENGHRRKKLAALERKATEPIAAERTPLPEGKPDEDMNDAATLLPDEAEATAVKSIGGELAASNSSHVKTKKRKKKNAKR